MGKRGVFTILAFSHKSRIFVIQNGTLILKPVISKFGGLMWLWFRVTDRIRNLSACQQQALYPDKVLALGCRCLNDIVRGMELVGRD